MSILRKSRTLTKNARLWRRSCFEFFLERKELLLFPTSEQVLALSLVIFGLHKEPFLEHTSSVPLLKGCFLFCSSQALCAQTGAQIQLLSQVVPGKNARQHRCRATGVPFRGCVNSLQMQTHLLDSCGSLYFLNLLAWLRSARGKRSRTSGGTGPVEVPLPASSAFSWVLFLPPLPSGRQSSHCLSTKASWMGSAGVTVNISFWLKL